MIEVTHSLGTTDVIVQARDTKNREIVKAAIKVQDENTVTLSFSPPIRVVVIG